MSMRKIYIYTFFHAILRTIPIYSYSRPNGHFSFWPTNVRTYNAHSPNQLIHQAKLNSTIEFLFVFLVEKNLGWDDDVPIQGGENLSLKSIYSRTNIYVIQGDDWGFKLMICQMGDLVSLYLVNPLGFTVELLSYFFNFLS